MIGPSSFAELRSSVTTKQARVLFLAAIVLFTAPAAVSALTYTPIDQDASPSGVQTPIDNVTFVSTQGTSTKIAAGVYAIDTDAKEVIWSDTNCPEKCYDLDPMGNDSLLYVSKTSDVKARNITDISDYQWYATQMNWRTGTVEKRFAVPPDTHDVDYIGDGQYLVANKVSSEGAEKLWIEVAKSKGWINESRQNHSHLLYIYDANKDDIVWEYDFREHFSANAGDEKDYTHVNDVDLVKNGSAILASPRNFDRVVLINRSTKETEWVLGEEDNYTVLREQHNPSLISTDPPTVLVADSDNHRVVEYRKEGTQWIQTWEYSEGLRWPRDADRLPNGNTLIVNTRKDQILEVTPQKEVVWEMDVSRMPYDVERGRHGDEPSGPAMYTMASDNASDSSTQSQSGVGRITETWGQYYSFSGWIFPPGVGQVSFAALHLSVLALVGWLGFEWRRWRG